MRRIYLFTIAFLAAVQVLVSQPAAADQKQARATQQSTQDLDDMTFGEMQAAMNTTVMQLKMAIAADPDIIVLEALLHTEPNPSITKIDAVNYILSMGALDPGSRSDQAAIYRIFEVVQDELGVWDNQAAAALVLQVMRYGDPAAAPSSNSGLYVDEKELERLKSLLAEGARGLIQKDQAYTSARNLIGSLGDRYDEMIEAYQYYRFALDQESRGLPNDLQAAGERYDQKFAQFKRAMGEARTVIGQLG